MSFSLCRLSWGFSALFISMIVFSSDASAQVHQKPQPNYLSLPINTSEAEAHTWQAQSHDYQSAGSLAISAADQCYIEKDLDECDKLHEIQNTIATWCDQDDPDACKLYTIVVDYSRRVQTIEMGNDMRDQIE
ncbi:MAG: hypothetical protein ACRC8K_07360 [Waterburya sp.]